MRILHVDDEPYYRTEVATRLSRQGYEVLSAVSGGDGLAMMRNLGPFDIVISDMRMHGMHGSDFIQQAKQEFPNVKFIILSGSPVDARPLMWQGVPFVSKRSTMDELLKAVKETADFIAGRAG